MQALNHRATIEVHVKKTIHHLEKIKEDKLKINETVFFKKKSKNKNLFLRLKKFGEVS